jgi:hypothetical protein
MCLSGADWVEAKVYDRLISKGVSPPRARGVARKVGRAYREKRLVRASLIDVQRQPSDPPAIVPSSGYSRHAKLD